MLDIINGREDGIRTHETFRFTHFPGVRLQPLGHLSINLLIVLLLSSSYPYEPRRTQHARYSARRVPHPFRGIIKKALMMLKIVPDDFSQPLGHLSINLLIVLLLSSSYLYEPRRTLHARYSARPALHPDGS